MSHSELPGKAPLTMAHEKVKPSNCTYDVRFDNLAKIYVTDHIGKFND